MLWITMYTHTHTHNLLWDKMSCMKGKDNALWIFSIFETIFSKHFWILSHANRFNGFDINPLSQQMHVSKNGFFFPLQNQFINFIVDMASNIESQYHAFLNVDIVNDLPFLRMTKHGWKHFFFLSKSFNNYIVITFHSCRLTKGRVQNIHKSTWNFSTIQFQDTIYPFVVSMLVE